MLSRSLGILILTGAMTFGSIGMAHAFPWGGGGWGGWGGGDGWGGWGGRGGGGNSAPELDPSALGGGLAMLIGGVLVLNERRRKNK